MNRVLKVSMAALLAVSTVVPFSTDAFAKRKHRVLIQAAADNAYHADGQCVGEEIIVPILIGAALGAGVGAVAGAIAFTTIPAGTVALGAGSGAAVGVTAHAAHCR